MTDGVIVAIIIVSIVIPLIIISIIIAASIRIIKEYERAIVFRFGRCIGSKGPGVFFVLPGIDKFIVVDTRTVTYDARMIKVITKDNHFRTNSQKGRLNM